ncbi:MAG: outer membrane beta-barrel protein [Rickettsiales bacterium]|nr:MAG: outer membrane beta-barrel protein [Rickettsiales bacterium]
MKKTIAILAVLKAVFSTVFAQDFSISVGAGGVFNAALGGGVNGEIPVMMDIKYSLVDEQIGGGGFIFFDATYAEINVSYILGSAVTKANSENSGASAAFEDKGTFSSINFGLLGKYPFEISDSFLLFPLLGIEYQLFLSRKDKDEIEYKNTDGEESPKDFSSLWFKLGVGADINITDQLYIRSEILYGIRLKNKYEDDLKESVLFSMFPDADIGLGHGPTVKIGIGYRAF